MIILAKIFSVILGLTVVTKTYYDFKKGNENIVMFSFWIITWISIMVISIDPNLVVTIANRIGDNGVGIGTFLGIAFVFLFYVTYRIYAKANRLERTLRDLVIKIGLKDLNEEE
jgi:hypothetical protein